MSLFDACRSSTRSSTGSVRTRSEKGTSSATRAWWTWRLGLSRRIWRGASLFTSSMLRVFSCVVCSCFFAFVTATRKIPGDAPVRYRAWGLGQHHHVPHGAVRGAAAGRAGSGCWGGGDGDGCNERPAEVGLMKWRWQTKVERVCLRGSQIVRAVIIARPPPRVRCSREHL